MTLPVLILRLLERHGSGAGRFSMPPAHVVRPGWLLDAVVAGRAIPNAGVFRRGERSVAAWRASC